MQELIYVSQRKLSQFQRSDTSKRKRRRLRDLGVTAPFAMGGIQVGFTDQTPPGAPSLSEVVRHLEPSGKPLKSIYDPKIKSGEWVRFSSVMIYHLFRDYEPDLEPRSDFYKLEYRERLGVRRYIGDRTALLFWNPIEHLPSSDDGNSANVIRDSPQPTRLLLHGAPAHLVGSNTSPASDWPQGLVRWDSHPTFLFDLLEKGPGPIFPEKRGGGSPFSDHLKYAFDALDAAYPPSLAFPLAGIALVSMVVERPFERFKMVEYPSTPEEKIIFRELPAWRAVIASPLYVERSSSKED